MIGLVLKQDGVTRFLEISGEAVQEYALELKKKLLELLRGGRKLEIRLHDLERIDLSALQLICAAHRQAVLQKKTLRLDATAAGGFATVCRRAGFVRNRGCRFEDADSCLWRGPAADNPGVPAKRT